MRSRRLQSLITAVALLLLPSLVLIATLAAASEGISKASIPDLSQASAATLDERPVAATSGPRRRLQGTVPAPVIPSDPPIAAKISFGPLNDLGESTITGAPGSVLPSAHVLLINLDTTHQDHVLSNPDGSFTAQLFAPPGSNIMIRHGPDHKYWQDVELGATRQLGLTIFPSTTIYRPHRYSAGPNELPFAAVGAFDIDDTAEPASIGGAWSITGTIGPVNDLNPGETLYLTGTVRLYSQAIISSTDVSTITLDTGTERPWLMLYDGSGNPVPYYNQSGSNRLTPSGLPILDGTRPELLSPVTAQPVTWKYAGGHIIKGDLSMDLSLGANLPPGIYRPIMGLEPSGVPSGSGWVAALTSWLAGLPSVSFNSSGAALPPLKVKAPMIAAGRDTEQLVANERLIWYLLMDNATLGTRGTGALQDAGVFQPSSFVVHQGAPYVLLPGDPFTGKPHAYRLEPYLPMIAYGRGTAPTEPLLPFKLPGGQLCVKVLEPDGQQTDLGCGAFAQSRSGDRSTALGELLNLGAIEVSEYYGLTTATSQFLVSFLKPGLHVIEMTGWVEDVWGNVYQGGGTYEVWVAHTFDIDPGIMPGTPLAVGDAINPDVQLQPRLPAYVNLTVRHYPYSDPNQIQVHAVEGWANRFGHFAPHESPIVLNEPGEFRMDLVAQYVDPDTGEMWMAAATWGSVVMTPPGQTPLVAHGRRGSDNVSSIPNEWFIFCDINLLPASTPHLRNPYLNGDILWSFSQGSKPECIGDALLMNASIQDTAGAVEAAIRSRLNRAFYPGTDFNARAQAGELPLFSSTLSGRPVSLVPGETDQVAYAYHSSQRPGVRVRETVAEDSQGSGYWRIDTMYDNQPGVGVEGDLPNDFKYQYVGVVYRDIVSGVNTYLGQASGWVHLPLSDTTGSRAMPPFCCTGNSGWPVQGGPLMTLKGQDIDMFIQPMGVRPGSVLQVGDRFEFGGQLMPTLDSRVEVKVTSPSGVARTVSGRANSVGYFHHPADSFTLEEPGLWTAAVTVWHDGQIGSGAMVNCNPADPFNPILPCPSGGVLGSTDGSYSFYVVDRNSERLQLVSPGPGRLTFGSEVTPIVVTGTIPTGVTNPIVDYTINMPGFILEEGHTQIVGDRFSFVFDPQALQADFANIDLNGRYGYVPGLADTFSFGILLSGEQNGKDVYQATTLTIQGDEVYVETADNPPVPPVFLPAILASN